MKSSKPFNLSQGKGHPQILSVFLSPINFHIKSALFIVILGFPSFLMAQESVDLGKGYSCTEEGLSIKSKVLNKKKAKRALGRKLKKLRDNRSSAKNAGKKKRVKKLNASIRDFNSVKRQIDACFAGELFGDPDTVQKVIERIAGSYENGAYDFSLDSNSALSGPVSGMFRVKGTTLLGDLSFDDFLGALFGGDLDFVLETEGENFPLQTTVETSTIGPIDIVLESDLSLTLLADDIPGDTLSKLEWTGTFDAETGFTGSVKLYDASDAVIFEGTIAVQK